MTTEPFWISKDGITYQTPDDMSREHLVNLVGYLKKRRVQEKDIDPELIWGNTDPQDRESGYNPNGEVYRW